MTFNTLKKIHDIVSVSMVLIGINWVGYGLVSSLAWDGYEANTSLSQSRKGIFIVSKRDKHVRVSRSEYRIRLLYWTAAWGGIIFVPPLLLISHLVGKKLDQLDPPAVSREEMINHDE